MPWADKVPIILVLQWGTIYGFKAVVRNKKLIKRREGKDIWNGSSFIKKLNNKQKGCDILTELIISQIGI